LVFSKTPLYGVGMLAPCPTLCLLLGLEPARNQQLRPRKGFKATAPTNYSTVHYKVKIGKINCFDDVGVADVKHRPNYVTCSTYLRNNFNHMILQMQVVISQ
jgi:hypothetical protein